MVLLVADCAQSLWAGGAERAQKLEPILSKLRFNHLRSRSLPAMSSAFNLMYASRLIVRITRARELIAHPLDLALGPWRWVTRST